jgi:hypothetical protein
MKQWDEGGAVAGMLAKGEEGGKKGSENWEKLKEKLNLMGIEPGMQELETIDTTTRPRRTYGLRCDAWASRIRKCGWRTPGPINPAHRPKIEQTGSDKGAR